MSFVNYKQHHTSGTTLSATQLKPCKVLTLGHLKGMHQHQPSPQITSQPLKQRSMWSDRRKRTYWSNLSSEWLTCTHTLLHTFLCLFLCLHTKCLSLEVLFCSAGVNVFICCWKYDFYIRKSWKGNQFKCFYIQELNSIGCFVSVFERWFSFIDKVGKVATWFFRS